MAGARTVSFYDYMEDIGVPLANIQRMRDDKVMEHLQPNYKIAIYVRGLRFWSVVHEIVPVEFLHKWSWGAF